jgi:hypothetical protein
MFNFAVNAALIGMDGLPTPTPKLPDQANTPITTFLNWAMGFGAVAVLGGLIIGGVMIAISQRRGEPSEKLAYVAWPIIGGIIILSATGIVKTLFNW